MKTGPASAAWTQPPVSLSMAEPEAGTTDVVSLTRRMRGGEEDAWRLFYALYRDRLWRYLLVVTRHEATAQEALQHTFLRVVRHVRVFEDESVFWSWLTVLARSAAADNGRKSRRYLAFLNRFFHHSQATVETGLVDADGPLLKMLEEGLHALAPDERWLMEQKYLKGCSLREISLTLHATEKSVESKLVRIRKKLKTAVLERLNHEERT
jgi:RNA polymerase sigma-70 factor (ECF subfamily)